LLKEEIVEHPLCSIDVFMASRFSMTAGLLAFAGATRLVLIVSQELVDGFCPRRLFWDSATRVD